MMLIKKAGKLLLDKCRNILRHVYMLIQKARLHNQEICLIASNCNGACILHDLGLQFRSPFVNLWIKPGDFLKLLHNLESYMALELTPAEEEGIPYPIGMLDDIKIYFQHDSSFREAKAKWDRRKQRMDFSHIFVLFSDRDGCTEENLMDFDRLPFNKAVFVHRPLPKIKSAVYIRGFEEADSVGMCMEYRNRFSFKKYYDDFDYVSWFNCEK